MRRGVPSSKRSLYTYGTMEQGQLTSYGVPHTSEDVVNKYAMVPVYTRQGQPLDCAQEHSSSSKAAIAVLRNPVPGVATWQELKAGAPAYLLKLGAGDDAVQIRIEGSEQILDGHEACRDTLQQLGLSQRSDLHPNVQISQCVV